MDWIDFTVYFWLLPVATQLLLPLAISCLGLGVFVLKRVGAKSAGYENTAMETSTT